MYMLVAFLALLAFLGGFGGKSAKNVECAKEVVTYTNCQSKSHKTSYTSIQNSLL